MAKKPQKPLLLNCTRCDETYGIYGFKYPFLNTDVATLCFTCYKLLVTKTQDPEEQKALLGNIIERKRKKNESNNRKV